MKIPDLPNVPIDMDEQTKSFVESLEDKIGYIDVVRVEEDNINVLGKDSYYGHRYYEVLQNRTSGEISETSFKDSYSLDVGVPMVLSFGIYSFAPHIRKREKQKREHEQKVEQFREANLNDIREKIKDIRVYQGTMDEVQKELGPLERIDTGKPETFLEEVNTFWLRVKAYLNGADAIVHYQPGSSIGTPVRYSNKKV